MAIEIKNPAKVEPAYPTCGRCKSTAESPHIFSGSLVRVSATSTEERTRRQPEEHFYQRLIISDGWLVSRRTSLLGPQIHVRVLTRFPGVEGDPSGIRFLHDLSPLE